MFNTTSLLDFRTGLQTTTNPEMYQARLDALIAAFTDYRIPVVTLKDLTVGEVCPIFERINSSGTKLSTYDLMVAATWGEGFDLNDEVDEIQDSLEPKGFGDIDRTTVLKCLSAVQLGTIKEESLKTLRDTSPVDMRALITKTKQALMKTVDVFSTEFKIHSWDFLAYEALVLVTCYIYADINHLSPAQVRRLRQWFWRSSFSERYKVGGENFVSRDLKTVRAFVVDATGTPEDFGGPPTDKDWMNIAFRSNVSRSRAYILALAARSPHNITNGARIDVADALSSYNRKQFHHVFPRAYLRRIGTTTNDNLLMNICMLAAAGNNAINDGNPNLYLRQAADALGGRADSVFASNLLPSPSGFDYTKTTYEDFLSARLPVVKRFIFKLCDGESH
jgi:hypothetical protein